MAQENLSILELRQLLQQESSQSGKNLYNHLIETLMKVLIDKPQNLYESFENISADVKNNPFNPNYVKGKCVPRSEEEIQKLTKWVQKNSSILSLPEESIDESGVKYPNLMDDAHLFEWAGISFSKSEVYRLYLTIKIFSESSSGDIERVRFVGKILTRSSPYYVIEGLSTEDEDDIDPLLQEGREGLNKYCYWVTQSLDASDGWIKLPNVTSKQIIVARQCNRFLAGNLEAEINSYPPFPGTEKNYLRSLLALIVSSTSISPDGFYEVDDNDPPGVNLVDSETLASQFPKPASDLNSADSWKHHEKSINVIGRTTSLPERLDENGDAIEEDPVETSTALENVKPEDWTFRICPGGTGQTIGSAVVAKSTLWPGASAIVVGSKFVNVYVGFGFRYNSLSYNPPLPATIQYEWKATEESTLTLQEQSDTIVDPTPPIPEEDTQEDQEED